MDSIGELRSCCRALDTDKVTERKKQTDKLKLLLGKTSIQKSLDENTDAKQMSKERRLFAWDDVLKVIVDLVLLEIVALKKAKESSSSITLNNREKKKQEIGGLVKFVVRLTDARGERLRSSSVVQHIIQVLKDPFTCQAFEPDYSSLLLKNILCVRKYATELSTKMWQELINIYCKLFQSPPSGFNKSILAKLICTFVKGASQQLDVRPRKLLSFFSTVFKHIRHEKSTVVVEQLVVALNTVSEFTANDGRKQLCRLGEEVFINLLFLLNSRPSETLKDGIIYFFHLQMIVHHPYGARTEETGAFAHDWELWQSHLRKLYETVYADLKQMGGRNKFSSGFKDVILNPTYLELITDLCLQLFTSERGFIEVTQASTLDGGPGAKKRRLESGWSTLREAVSSTALTMQSVPWLQLLGCLLNKYPESLPESEVTELLHVLLQIITECKRNEVMGHCLSCTESLANAVALRLQSKQDDLKHTLSLWNKVWAASLRLVSLHQSTNESFRVMSALIKGHLIKPNTDMWNLFFSNICTPAQDSLEFLTICLSEQDIPDNYQPSVLGFTHSADRGSFNLRKQLCDWLLISDSNIKDQSVKHYCLSNGCLLGEILAALLRRDCQKSFKFIRQKWLEGSKIKKHVHNKIEDLYLSYTFNQPLDGNGEVTLPSEIGDISSPCISILMDHIYAVVGAEEKSIQDICEPQLQTLEWMAHRCVGIFSLLYSMISSGALSQELALQTPLVSYLKICLKTISGHLSEKIKKDGICSVKSTLSILESLMEVCPLESARGDNSSLHLLHTVIPSSLINTLLEEAFQQTTSRQRSNSRLNSSSSLSKRHRVIDELDLESEFSNNNTEELSLDDSPQDVEDTIDDSKAYCVSPVSIAALSESHMTRLQVIRILVKVSKGELLGPAVRQKLEDLVDDPLFDPSINLHIHILREILQGFAFQCQLTGENLQKILDPLRQVAKYHRRDQDVCALVLDLLSIIIPCMSTVEDIDEDIRQECLEIMMKLLAAYWKLHDGGDAMHKVRLSLSKCLEAILKSKLSMECKVIDGSGDSDELTVWEAFLLSISDNSLPIRRYTANSLTCLFKHPSSENLPNAHEVFAKLYEFIQDTLDLEGKLTEDEQLDETLNRASSLLTALINVVCHCLVCEKKAIFTCIQLIKEKNPSLPLVKKGLNLAANHLGYKSLSEYLPSHLKFLVSNWLDVGYDITDFPYDLMDYSTQQDFFQNHYKVIFPCLLIRNKVQKLKNVCLELKFDWLKLVEECIPETLVYVFPIFAMCDNIERSPDNAIKRKYAQASACYDMLLQNITPQVVEKCIVSNLDNIVVNTLMTLYQTDNGTGESDRCEEPEPNPPFYNSDVITATFSYLTKSFPVKHKTLVSVLSKTQDAIQNILMSLAVHISETRRAHEKLRILMMYRVFVELLAQEFHHQLGGSWAFVLREVIYRMLHTFNDVASSKSTLLASLDSPYQNALEHQCIDILSLMCQAALNNCAEELGKYLSWIVSHLVGYIHLEAGVSTKILELLHVLCVENAHSLTRSIASLDQFSEDLNLKELRKVHKKLKYASGDFTLEQEIEHFLRASLYHNSAPESRLGGLRFLQEQMSRRSEELSLLLTECQANPKQSVLCQLVWELVQLCTSTNERVRIAASRCLGEIGPVNLGLVSMPISHLSPKVKIALEKFEDNPHGKKYSIIFSLLDDCLSDHCMKVVQSASQVLKAALSTQSGQRFCEEYKNKLMDKDFLFHYLHPFQMSKKSSSRGKPLNVPKPTEPSHIDDTSIWCPDHTNHKDWIRGLVVRILDSGAVKDEILTLLKPVCQVKTKFCEVVLPYLIHDILQNGSVEQSKIFSQQISNFFTTHCQIEDSEGSSQSSSHHNKSESICCNKKSVKVLLSVIQYLRHQARFNDSKRTQFENNLWLNINYCEVAKAAFNCSAFFTSLLYTEIAWEIQRLHQSDSRRGGRRISTSGRTISQNSELSESSTDSSQCSQLTIPTPSGVNTEDLLLQTYLSIGDPDGLYGCGVGRRADNTSRIQTYEHENVWDKAAVAYAVKMNHPDPSTQTGFLQSMKNCGSYSLVGKYLEQMNEDSLTSNPQLEELKYESAWRLGQWNMDVPNNLQESSVGFHKSMYCALKAFHENQQGEVIGAACTVARCISLKKMTEVSWESSRSLYPILSNLSGLNHIENMAYTDNSMELVSKLLEKWTSYRAVDLNGFDYIELGLQVQSCLLNAQYRKSPSQEEILTTYVKHLCHVASKTRLAGRFELSGHILSELKSLPVEDSLSWQVEEACLYWDRGEQTTGKHLLKTFIDKLSVLVKQNSLEAARLYPLVLMKYGNWLADTRSDSPNVIMEKYLDKAVDWLSSHGDSAGVALDAHLSVARYADAQYQNIVNYMKSNTFESKQNLMKKAKEELEKYKNLAERRDRYLSTLKKQSQIDDMELKQMEEDRKSFLLRALQNYIKCLQCGDKHDLRIFRVISLWFDNASLKDVNVMIMETLDGVKSQKFLPLMYQLAARMSINSVHNQLFKPTLDRLIERTSTDHPYQTLFIILALAHANKDTELLNQGRGDNRRGKLKKSTSDLDTPDEERVRAAKTMVEKLRSSTVGGILQGIEKLCVAYIELANWPVEKYKTETKPISLPNALKLTQIKNLTSVVSPTSVIPVDPSCDYKDIAHIVGFQPTFKLAGGVNLPKIITCISSDGTWSKQLVKGRDDLRQDAVMQQVFEMVNSLLQKESETRQRALSIRTYKVVPLSQRSGLLEWCEGTQPIGEYLVGPKGAHSRYRPHDLIARDCRRKMSTVQGEPRLEKKHRVYLEVCSQFQPIFRHFFLENYLDPTKWYEKRLAYTKSVATTSIVGYILGLGDRHVQNILIDCNSAELIHIDLGVAFEQGHILPTPETVPFRLTRDIVDGMGVTGVEGVFRRCCEKTMEVMHQNQESLLTILQVLLYDPLYTWTISPLKAYNLQQDRQNADTSDLNTSADLMDDDENNVETADKVNKLAERVLLRLHQKLQGIEDGVQLSVSGQVNHLIQEARDSKNLCKLFPGWQPYI